MSKVRLIRGDNLDVLPLLPDESVDSIVTDPPYGLSKEPDVAEVLTHWLAGDDYNHRGGGFMGKAWDSFVPGPSVWRECLRVLKPGGYFLCFAGSRTVDLMGMAIRLAGFEIRDQMQWLYGSGFPKSMDVAKAIDKQGHSIELLPVVRSHIVHWRDVRGMTNADLNEAMGFSTKGSGMASHWTDHPNQAEIPSKSQWVRLREVLGWDKCDLDAIYDTVKDGAQRPVVRLSANGIAGGTGEHAGIAGAWGFRGEFEVTSAATDDAKRWEGWGTALKPAHEPIVMARKPFRGTVAANVLAHGTGAINIDGSRIAMVGEMLATPQSDPAKPEGVVGTDLGITGADKEKFQAAQAASIEKANTMGRFPANVLLAHHPECKPTGEVITERVGGGAKASKTDSTTVDFVEGYERGDGWTGGEITTEVWDCHPDCAVRLLDEQSGILTSGKPAGGSGPHKAKASVGKGGGPALEGSADGSLRKEGVEYHLYGDSGGASRFFYCSKTSKAERNAGLPEGMKNDHPTVKPVRLMEYLVRLVTPPGGTVLDPYIGSGTTGIAAANLGFDCIGIDRDDEGTYIDLAAHRVRHAGGEVQKQAFVSEAG